MLKNYLKIALRNLFKKKGYSFINILGLSTGIACCLLILLFVQDEIGFDKFHKNSDNIFRVIEERKNADGSKTVIPLSSGMIGPMVKEQLPQIEEYTRIISSSATGRFTVKRGENKFYSGSHIFTEPAFFKIFDFELIKGNKSSALTEPNAVILTESAVEKYFGSEDVFEKTIDIEGRGDFKITGIMKDPPQNSHLAFDLVFSLESLMAIEGWRNWINSAGSDWITSYMLLKPNSDFSEAKKQITKIGTAHFRGTEINSRTISIQKLNDIHFGSAGMEFDYLNANPGDEAYVYILSVVAGFILLIACINFMNLSIARSLSRAKEVGLRKVMGAYRSNLFKQFLGESILLAFLSLFFSIFFIEILLPLFNSITGKDIAINYLDNWTFVGGIILLTILVGLLSGSYPAFYLSKFQPVKVLKGSQLHDSKSSFRRILVVTQFVLSIVMIAATLIAYDQLEFIRDKNLGFKKENTIVVDINSGESRKSFKEIKNEISKHPEVKSVTVSSRVPGEWKNLPQIDAVVQGSDAVFEVYHLTIDQNFIDSYALDLLSGRNFSEEMGNDSSSIIINETAAKLFGLEDPLGKIVRVPSENFEAKVIGIVKDFHFESLHKKISPIILGYLNNPFRPIDYFSIKVSDTDIAGTLSYLQMVHEKFDKVTPFEYNFLDERIQDFYVNDARFGKLFAIASILSIIIACLGLFALSSYISELKTKEIGIRKVLGASIPAIVFLLSKDFLKLIIIASILAVPLSYYAMNEWLQDFAYRISIQPGAFIFAGSLTFVIAFATICFQAVKAAAANPVKSLKYE